MRKHFLNTVAIATTSLVLGQIPAVWAQQLVPAQSEITFTFHQMGVPVTGKFQRFAAEIALDPAQLETSRVKIDVDTASATIGNAETDAELIKADWFNTAAFPHATFESTAIKATGDNAYEATGTLTIKGEQRQVSVPVKLDYDGSVAVATGSVPIERLAFKIGDGAWSDTSMVANEVQVNFKLTLDGMTAP
ncbi:polyisoprenoid-binding protein [Lampropedia cohaerens]|uniref:Polyisoprenoid-binding protein n=1 Tax=Lampropedia cohaerens TaxID=1610491 RepID=A0A0U1Q1V2_9BURK|nr:YceI family protein [Lampropedia cohaerens]KKW68733.1 polyisoprenoid-binding protein [Lampropedia cohaerens]